MNVRKIILQAYREELGRPFAWSVADCLQWCGLVAERLTGSDPGEGLRARYRTKAGAARVMRAEGWSTMGDVAASLLPEIPLARARSGDWVQCRDRQGNDGLGVVCADKVAVRGPGGLGYIPLAWAQRAFRVEY